MRKNCEPVGYSSRLSRGEGLEGRPLCVSLPGVGHPGPKSDVLLLLVLPGYGPFLHLIDPNASPCVRHDR